MTNTALKTLKDLNIWKDSLVNNLEASYAEIIEC